MVSDSSVSSSNSAQSRTKSFIAKPFLLVFLLLALFSLFQYVFPVSSTNAIKKYISNVSVPLEGTVSQYQRRNDVLTDFAESLANTNNTEDIQKAHQMLQEALGSSSQIGSSFDDYKPPADSTGYEFTFNKEVKCGGRFYDYINKVLPSFKGKKTPSRPFVWTVAGGPEYRKQSGMLLAKWESLGLFPVMVIALEQETADNICAAGFNAVVWDDEKHSYSRVADSKFTVAAELAERNIKGFFLELDVFCRKNPLPFFESFPDDDLIHPGHGDVNFFPNIGMYMVSTRMGPYFRGLNKIMAFSKTERNYINQVNHTRDFFDQDAYTHCLPAIEDHDDDIAPSEFSYYLMNDTKQENNILKLCKNEVKFTFKTVHHTFINCLFPPSVYDNTICIHPLAGAPFTPLAYKHATAKFLGFDPLPIGKDERMVKMAAGDLTTNECWGHTFYHGEEKIDGITGERVALYVSTLITIARETNRTVVLPRFVRDKESWAYPLHGVLDVRRIDVPWRWLTKEESYRLEDETDMMVSPRDPDKLLKEVKQHDTSRILAIDGMCKLTSPSNERREELNKGLCFCFDRRGLKFTKSIGSWDNMCNCGPLPQ